MTDCTERDIEAAGLLAITGLVVRESPICTDDCAVRSGGTVYVRMRREGETLADVLGAVKGGIILPPPEPWPVGPLVLMPAAPWHMREPVRGEPES